jgi:hypothetical protein
MGTVLDPSEYLVNLRGQNMRVCIILISSLAESDVMAVLTLDAHKLPKFESGSAHLGELRHQAFDVGFAHHD